MYLNYNCLKCFLHCICRQGKVLEAKWMLLQTTVMGLVAKIHCHQEIRVTKQTFTTELQHHRLPVHHHGGHLAQGGQGCSL
jgi:hypothetical protein